jgi:[ribosomal protein S5]-alanine N-acetyltransferase
VSLPHHYFLTTDRLGFSHWNEGDSASALTLWGDPKVAEFIGGPFTAEEVSARLRRELETMSTHRVQYWPVFLLQKGDLAGCAGLRPYGEDAHVLELGFHFRPKYWGQGLAEEAARAVIAYAFETLALKSLFAGHHPANVASERLLKKLGFCWTHQEIYPPTGLLNPAYRLVNPKGP